MFDIDSFDLRLRAVPDGGVTSARGFKAAGIHAGFRKNPERLDFAMVAAEAPVAAAGVFTTNRFCAAPVQVCMFMIMQKCYNESMSGAVKG